MTISPGRWIAAAIALAAYPLHWALAALIRQGDGGPPLYRSFRLGLHGQSFSMLKYRTMAPDAPVVLGAGYKTLVAEHDPRVTPLGRILRGGIDEFPQLWNIARGEMTWVGPRPDESWMLPNYGPEISERLAVRPGATGLAQVLNARYLSTAQSYALDIWYVRHRSWTLDAWVLAVTPFFLLGWRGVARRRLRKLLATEEVAQLEAACERELEGEPLACLAHYS